MSIKTKKYSRFAFEKGLGNLAAKDVKAARQELMNAIGITTRENLLRRASGVVAPTVPEYEAIEKIFEKYGIPKNKIWGFKESTKHETTST